MKYLIKTFEQFVNEAVVHPEFDKVLVTREARFRESFFTGPKYRTKDYWMIATQSDNMQRFPDDFPVFIYDKKCFEKLQKEKNYRPKQVYNKIEARDRVVSKAKFYSEHKDSEFILPTALDKNGIKNLNFPIVAKPDKEHSGLGIQVFKNAEDLNNTDLSAFSSFSEKANIKEEHRIFMWRTEPITWTQRVPMNDETKDISKKDPKDKTDFSYVLKKGQLPEKYTKALSYFADKHSDLDFYAIDLIEDAKENVYVLELNTEPGALFGVMAIVYQKIYEDYYDKPLSSEAIKTLEQYRQEDIVQNTKQNPKWKAE